MDRKNFRRTILTIAIGNAISMAQAATILVNSGEDTIFDDGICTLREAVISANTNPLTTASGCVSGEPGLDTIEFSGVDEIRLYDNSSLSVTDDLNIIGTSMSNNRIYGYYNAGIFSVDNAQLSISNMMLLNASAALYAGAIDISNSSNVTVESINFNNNFGSTSGAVSVRSGSSATISNSLFNMNSGAGGAVVVDGLGSSAEIVNTFLLQNGGSVGGGAARAVNQGQLTINNSTLQLNNAPQGAALFVENARIELINSTISNNESTANGGAIAVVDGGVASLTRTTIADNRSYYANGGAISVSSQGQLSVQNSLIVGNRAALIGQEIFLESGASVTSQNNLFGRSDLTNAEAFVGFTPSATDILATSDGNTPTLRKNIIGPLVPSGGATTTRKLPLGSPAIDAGNDAICQASPLNGLDQRGVPLQGICDIGSLEVKTSTISVNSNAGGSVEASCTFEDAIASATSRTTVANCVAGADINFINFDPAVFPANTENSIGIDNRSIVRYSDIYVQGRGVNGLTLDLQNEEQAFYLYEATLNLDQINITGGSFIYGGGGAIQSSKSNLHIKNGSLHNNVAGGAGGAIRANTSNIYLDSVTLRDNVADFGGGLSVGSFSNLEVKNSTLSGNTARLYGGGMSIGTFSNLNLINVTITGNSAQDGGGLELIGGAQTRSIVNSLIAGNQATINGDEILSSINPLTEDESNIFGDDGKSNSEAFVGFFPGNNSFNLTSDSGSPMSLESLIQPLVDNGGFGLTHLLSSSSFAIDNGNNSFCISNQITQDQRGEDRDDFCDIGATEIAQAEEESNCFVVPTKNGKTAVFCL